MCPNISETLDKSLSHPAALSSDEVPPSQHDTDEAPSAIPSYTELIKSESVCEITHEDENAYFEEKEDLAVAIEPVQLTPVDAGEMTSAQIDEFYSRQDEKFTELIDRLIEQENAKLLASGQLSYESDSDSSEEEVDLRAHKCSTEPQQSAGVVNGEPSNDSASDADDANLHVDANGKLHQRKVAFRLNSTEDDLVYPGQTDSEECTSSSDNSSEEVVDNTDEKSSEDDVQEESKPAEPVETAPLEARSNFAPSTEVERKFERMASETLEEEGGKMAEGEFHRIVSQLSLEEVDDCLNAWNEAEVAIGHEKALQLEGTA